jgi:O-antigen ligase
MAGGVDPLEWHWIAAAIAISTLACVALRSRRTCDVPLTLEERLLLALAGWMLLALCRLPPAVVALLSPHRAATAMAARTMLHVDPAAWLPLSTAPPATIERLLFVLPAMATFAAAREMPRWWTGRRAWIAVAPVIAAAAFEGMLGLTQFLANIDGPLGARSISGTYVNRNHYAGLLELAVPLALAWTASLWTRRPTVVDGRRPDGHSSHGSAGTAVVGGVLLLAAASAMLVGVMLSSSRMGLAATLVAIAVVWYGSLVVWRRAHRPAAWLWLLPMAILPLLVVFVSSSAMVMRLGETAAVEGLGREGRFQLWAESWRLFRAYPLTGAGLGTFEHALYPFRTWMPMNAVDFAHNDFLQLLGELGAIGFVLAMTLAALVVAHAARVCRSLDSDRAWLGLGLLASVVAAGLHGLVDFNLYIPANALALAWLSGVVVSPGLLEENA